jgi:hypothetical protein
MWRLPKIDHEYVGLCITPTKLIASWIRKQKTGSAYPYQLKAYKEIPLSDGTMCNNRLFNQTRIIRGIRSFLDTHGLDQAYIMLAVEGPGIIETFVADETEKIMVDSSQRNTMLWRQQYLYTYDDVHKIFYRAGMSRELLMQYMLLFIQARLNLIGLVPFFVPSLVMYKRIHDAAFRRTQLASDMQQYNNQLHHTCTREHIKRLLAAVPADINTEMHQGLTLSLGLFLLGSDYEKYQFC